jgi:hypothetical protein
MNESSKQALHVLREAGIEPSRTVPISDNNVDIYVFSKTRELRFVCVSFDEDGEGAVLYVDRTLSLREAFDLETPEALRDHVDRVKEWIK